MQRHNGTSSRGFTLMELIAAVAIVGILAAIAVPSYSGFVARGNRAVAQRALSELATLQEQYFLRHRRYATAAQLLGDSAGYSVDRRGNRTTVTANQIYAITMTGTNNYVLTATAPTGSSQAKRDPDCLTLSLSATGTRTATKPACWGD